MAVTTQIGTALKIGFTGNTITSLIMEEVNKEASGEQAIIKDEDNATVTVLVSDLGNRISFNAIVIDAYSDALPPALGSTVTVGTTKYRVESASFKQVRGANTLSVSAIREASMEATYDA
jgi:hypothetical protein